jgi:hypothetical protein
MKKSNVGPERFDSNILLPGDVRDPESFKTFYFFAFPPRDARLQSRSFARWNQHRRNPLMSVDINNVGGGSMKKVKCVIGSIFLVGVCVTSLWAEYNLVVRFPIMVSVVSVPGLLALLGALLRAPEGYENENGFHIRARRKQARRPRHVLAMSGSWS